MQGLSRFPKLILTDVPQLPYFLCKVAPLKDIQLLSLMCTFIRRLQVTPTFLQSLQNWQTIEFYLGAVAELNLERDCKKGYLLIDYLGMVEFVEDFLIFLPVAMHHLRTYRTLANFVIRFLLLL
jgi:hypothetical protein